MNMVLIRDVLKKECPWLPWNMRAGEVVTTADGDPDAAMAQCCCSPGGIMVKLVPEHSVFVRADGEAMAKFYELPEEALAAEEDEGPGGFLSYN